MSEYEMASLHAQLFGLIFSANVGMFGVVSAFMAASFVAAHRLTRTMAFITVLLFVLYSVGVLIAAAGMVESFMRLSAHMHDYAESGRGLSWHLTSQARSQELRLVSLYFTAATLVLAHLAALFFFFHCRRVNRQLAGEQSLA